MKEETIDYKHEKASLEAFIAYDETQGKSPAILIFHAWNGRGPFVLEKAKWLAQLGYIGCAIDMYGKGVIGHSVEENGKLMEPFMKDRAHLRDRMHAGMEAVVKHSMVDKNRLGAIGFCFGGLCALDLARSGAPLKGVVSLHGLLKAPEKLKTHPIRAKILALHGHDDPMVTPDQVLAFEKEMTKMEVDWQIHIYGKTAHGFTNPTANFPDMGIVYQPVSEKRAFLALKNFFSEIF